jgi:hypothetical protein
MKQRSVRQISQSSTNDNPDHAHVGIKLSLSIVVRYIVSLKKQTEIQKYKNPEYKNTKTKTEIQKPRIQKYQNQYRNTIDTSFAFQKSQVQKVEH